MNLLKHQLDFVDSEAALAKGYGLLWDMGCGKTLATLAHAKRLHEAGHIDSVLVVAPNMIHSQWITDELPKFWSTFSDLDPWRQLIYDCSRAGSQEFRRALQYFVTTFSSRLQILAITYDALLTDRGYDAAEGFVSFRRCMIVADESARIKNPQAKRTKRLLKLGALAAYRRILTGTPVANSPFDVYTQVQFLDPGFWASHGFASYWAFRTHFGVFEQRYVHAGGARRPFQQCTGYQNLDELNALLKLITSRVMKSEVLDLPPVVFTRRMFTLPKQNRELYCNLRDTFVADIRRDRDIGHTITASHALTRMVRLHQITSGMFQSDLEDTPTMLDRNPRLDLLREITEDISSPTIIWTRFTRSTDLVMELLGDRACRFDGEMSREERAKSLEDFTSGRKQFFVSKPSVGGEGFNLTNADTMIFYEKDFSAMGYKQAIARANRYGQSKSLQVISLCAQDTIDVKIDAALQVKQQLSDEVLGDEPKFSEIFDLLGVSDGV